MVILVRGVRDALYELNYRRELLDRIDNFCYDEPMKINILPPKIFNLLAAGEVVENPASVVKECVENSLDAGATQIEVAITKGGLVEIKISDNGHGVEDSEVEKIFLPHATSKIEKETDLEAIKTLGFRGEAMSSLARVSKVNIITKTKESKSGTQLSLDGGEVTEKKNIGANPGTTITIKNLFFNTPARKKFLSSEGVERNNVTNIVQKFILANPTVSFRYTIDGEVYYNYTGKGLLDAIELVYGIETTQNLIEVNAVSPDYKLGGFIGMPNFTKRNRTYQTVMVNGRTLQGGVIAEAAANALGTYMMQGTYPFFVLNLGIDEGSLDVNIHPRKLQIKFDDEGAIKDFIHTAVIAALDEYLYQKNKELQLPKKEAPPMPDINFVDSVLNFADGTDNKIMSAPHTMKKLNEKYYIDEPVSPTQAVFKEDTSTFKSLGVVFGCYILVSKEQKLYLIDQHAAAERALYDKLKVQIDEGGVVTQPLVAPLMLHLNPTELNAVTPILPVLEKIGIQAELFGSNCVCIRAVPVSIATFNALEEILRGILGDVKKLKLSQLLEEKLLQIACKNSLRGGRTLTSEQIKLFLDSFQKTGIPPLCPHGRPVLIALDKGQVEKMFARK